MTETLEEMIARLSMSKGRCPCGARPGEPCTRPSGAVRLPHVGRGDLPPDMVIDPAAGPDYTGEAFVRRLQADPVPAPTPADDVAALRAEVEAHWRDGQLPNYMSALFDRLAGALPQRATDGGEPVWQHACGFVFAGPEQRPDDCPRDDEDAWRALYTLGGE